MPHFKTWGSETTEFHGRSEPDSFDFVAKTDEAEDPQEWSLTYEAIQRVNGEDEGGEYGFTELDPGVHDADDAPPPTTTLSLAYEEI